MEGRYIILADDGIFHPSGRLDLIGGDLERITVPSLPAIMQPFKIVAKLHLDLDEKNVEHNFRVLIKDPSGLIISQRYGGKIGPMNRPFDPKSLYAGISILFTHSPLNIEKEGKYLVELIVDDETILTTSFYIFVAPIKPAENVSGVGSHGR